jgi:hypothetical protein
VAGGAPTAARLPITSRLDRTPIGYDYVHSLIDDYSRLAYSESLLDEQGRSCARFLLRAAIYFADHGIGSIHRVMTEVASPACWK